MKPEDFTAIRDHFTKFKVKGLTRIIAAPDACYTIWFGDTICEIAWYGNQEISKIELN
jgi:hypothetical protein